MLKMTFLTRNRARNRAGTYFLVPDENKRRSTIQYLSSTTGFSTNNGFSYLYRAKFGAKSQFRAISGWKRPIRAPRPVKNYFFGTKTIFIDLTKLFQPFPKQNDLAVTEAKTIFAVFRPPKVPARFRPDTKFKTQNICSYIKSQ